MKKTEPARFCRKYCYRFLAFSFLATVLMGNHGPCMIVEDPERPHIDPGPINPIGDALSCFDQMPMQYDYLLPADFYTDDPNCTEELATMRMEKVDYDRFVYIASLTKDSACGEQGDELCRFYETFYLEEIPGYDPSYRLLMETTITDGSYDNSSSLCPGLEGMIGAPYSYFIEFEYGTQACYQGDGVLIWETENNGAEPTPTDFMNGGNAYPLQFCSSVADGTPCTTTYGDVHAE